jgi:hypothetical protein
MPGEETRSEILVGEAGVGVEAVRRVRHRLCDHARHFSTQLSQCLVRRRALSRPVERRADAGDVPICRKQ